MAGKKDSTIPNTIDSVAWTTSLTHPESRLLCSLHQLLRLLSTSLGLHSLLVDFLSLHEPYQRILPAFLGEDSVA